MKWGRLDRVLENTPRSASSLSQDSSQPPVPKPPGSIDVEEEAEVVEVTPPPTVTSDAGKLRNALANSPEEEVEEVEVNV